MDPVGSEHAPSEMLSTHLLTRSAAETDVESQHVLMDEDAAMMGQPHHLPEVTTGEKQPPQYRDVGFAIAFLLQVVVVLFLAFFWGIPALKSNTSSSSGSYPPNTTTPSQFRGVVKLSVMSGVVAMAISTAALALMTRFARELIQISIGLFTFLAVCQMITFFVAGLVVMACSMLLFVAWGVWYYFSVARRINFAAANLVTAVQAIRSNLGVVVVAFVMVFISFVWSIVWVLASVGTYAKTSHCDKYDDKNECTSQHSNAFVFILLLLSFYWTHQVIQNILHVTVTGVVGTFWFSPEDANSFCSPSVYDSWTRASTLSLGSVALGSLLVAIMQSLHYLIHRLRQDGRDSILACLVELCVAIVEEILEYFNKWGFVYVGVYGYSYVEAGHKVMTLFHQRGWTNIINDNLVSQVLTMMSVIVGLSTAGAMAFISIVPRVGQAMTSSSFGGIEMIVVLSFIIGMGIASVLMRVVSSAVDTVVVCFAEAPNVFRSHHPHLHQSMVVAWRNTYPNEFGG